MIDVSLASPAQGEEPFISKLSIALSSFSFLTRRVWRTYFIYYVHKLFEWQCGHGGNLKGAMGGGQNASAEEVLDHVLIRHLDNRNEIILS